MKSLIPKKNILVLFLTAAAILLTSSASLAAKFGFGLAYVVANHTRNNIVASSTLLKPEVMPANVKIKKYTIGKGEHDTHESSMYIKDDASGKNICKVNAKVKAKNPFFKDPEITHKSATIENYVYTNMKCVIQSVKETKMDGDEIAVVYVKVVHADETINPMDSEPK